MKKEMESRHKPVLLNETIEGLDLHDGGVVLDGTLGGGGHALEICRRFPGAKIIALDQDAGAIRQAREKFKDCRINFHNENFRNLDKVLKKEGLEKVSAVILDLGLSSDQLQNSSRGFSFMKSEPLFMTMKENPRPDDLTAEMMVNEWREQSLADIIYGYGQERYGRKIARGIVEAREKGRIKTTAELVEIIRQSVPPPYRRGKIHFATRTFQALRVAVNDELRALSEGLAKGFEALKPSGRMAVISFHSLEDRIVKKFFKQKEKENRAKLINKKPIVAGEEELKENPKSRSAKLRIAEKIK